MNLATAKRRLRLEAARFAGAKTPFESFTCEWSDQRSRGTNTRSRSASPASHCA